MTAINANNRMTTDWVCERLRKRQQQPAKWIITQEWFILSSRPYSLSSSEHYHINYRLPEQICILTILCWIHSWWEYVRSPPRSKVNCDLGMWLCSSSRDAQTIKRNRNSSLKNLALTWEKNHIVNKVTDYLIVYLWPTSEIAFWKKPAGRTTYTWCTIAGK